MSEYFIVKNWERFQHYKDRNPPWIKLHYELLSSETWVSLDDASRVLAVACMLIASRNEGKVPNNPAYMKRVAYLNRVPNFKPLLDIGFLVKTLADASTMQADASNNLANDSGCKRMLDQRKKVLPKGNTIIHERFDDFWSAYPKRQGANPKSRAQEIFTKACQKVDPEIIIQGAKAYAAMCRRDRSEGTKYVAQAVTWLGQERWGDDYAQPTQAQSCGAHIPGVGL